MDYNLSLLMKVTKTGHINWDYYVGHFRNDILKLYNIEEVGCLDDLCVEYRKCLKKCFGNLYNDYKNYLDNMVCNGEVMCSYLNIDEKILCKIAEDNGPFKRV